jgi:hypothetical protein
MTLEQFAEAADFLHVNGIDLRAFILVQPPFIKPDEALYWAERSLDFAFACDATAASLIPTRGGNGAMETLAASGQFVIPQLALIEDAMSYGLRLRRGRVFVDLWDLQKGSECSQCFAARVDRLQSMNLSQLDRNVVACDLCGGRS